MSKRIKLEKTDFIEINEEEDFIPPDFFDDLLIENVAKRYIEQTDLQEVQNQQEINNFTTLQEKTSDEIHDNYCEIYQKWSISEKENHPHILNSKNNYTKFLDTDGKEEVFNNYSSYEISSEQNNYTSFNGITEHEHNKFDSDTIHYRNLTPKTEETFNSLDNLDNELISDQKVSDEQMDLNQNNIEHFYSDNNLSSLDKNYITERLFNLRREIRYLRFKISKNPPTNILTKLTYHMAACNNERILLEKYESQGKHMEYEEYQKYSSRTDYSASMVHTELRRQRMPNTVLKKPYNRKVNNLVKTPLKTYNTTKIYNQYINYDTNYNYNQYYQADIRTSFYNEDFKHSHHMPCNGIEHLNTYKPFESLDYKTKEYKLNRLSDLQNALRNCANLPNRQFNSMLSEIIKIHIYLLRYEHEINAKFERERQFLQ